MELIERIYRAFAQAPQPEANQITQHRCDECDTVRDMLAPFLVREVPDLEAYPLYSALPRLTAQAYRYYLPRYIAQALGNPSSLAGEMLIYSIAQEFDERVSAFSLPERAAILEFVDYLETMAQSEDDIYYVITARRLWQ